MAGLMNRIKKLTVFMLTFTVCVSSFCTAQCRAEGGDAEKAEESVRLMTALGIFVPDRFDEYDSENHCDGRILYVHLLYDLLYPSCIICFRLFHRLPL